MISLKTSKTGVTGHIPTSTKPHVLVFGGHCGQGMVMATEIANSNKASCITTVSRRGRPDAPGPASAFAQAMALDTVHYMAACDPNDAKAVQCLMDWQPASTQQAPPQQQEGQDPFPELMADLKKEIGAMSQNQLERASLRVDELKLNAVKAQRALKGRLQNKGCQQEEKKQLQNLQLDLQDKEATLLELLADLSQKLDATPPSQEGPESVEKLLKRLDLPGFV
eukprot:TRINITY_DN31969_c0_g1_i1.p1 TRINITY_DN31969_c0_g1~~TRINITY_DN31969_c0_g1_i1.p1  ORF type:complete len:224 (+),score=54.27 TRINITY_DN31969_c0_g1_i1:52-723(+)